MNRSISSRQIATALALAAAAAVDPARADFVMLGSDYFETIQPTFFTPLGALNPLAGLPINPATLGTTDTIVQRQADCALVLATAGSNCTIPIEMVALSLISTVNPMVRLRETPGSVVGASLSGGSMTITSDGLGSGGTFTSSFFDVFFDLSNDGGISWAPQGSLPLSSTVTPWTTVPQGLLIHGMRNDQSANRHDIPGGPACPVGMSCVDFFVPLVTEQHPGAGVHTARPAQPLPIPEPGGLALVGTALAALGLMNRFGARRKDGKGPA